MQPQCIYCSSTTNLSTKLTISLENGSKATVDICDTHAEEATVKTAREAYLKKQAMIDEVIKQAQALGINIGQPTNSGLVVAQQVKAPTPEPQTNSIDEFWAQDDGEGWLPTSKVDAISNKGMRSIGGNTEFGSVMSYSSYAVSGEMDKLPEKTRDGKVKVEIFEGRAGVPLAVPSKRVDGTGTTHIKIVKSENDETLQRRFKGLANSSMQDKQPDFRHGYDDSTRQCPFCNGAGLVKGKGCPKCGGAGIISLL